MRRLEGLSVALLAALLVAGGTASSADRTFAAGEGLPDGRKYELVSPPGKGGNDIVSDGARTRVAADGSAAEFFSLGAFADAVGTGISTEFMGVRGKDGWTTHSITPLHDPQSSDDVLNTFDPHYIGDLAPDLGTGVYTSATPLGADDGNAEGVKNLYLRRNLLTAGKGGYELITQAAGPVVAPTAYRPLFAGASTNFEHVIFMSALNLTPDALAQTCAVPGNGDCNPRLYEYTGGAVQLVGKVPVLPATSCSGADCIAAERSIPGHASSVTQYTIDTISRDGRRIFFTVAGSPSESEGDLYVREDGARTVQINTSERVPPGTSTPAIFQGASADGSKVFFTTSEQLIDDDHGGIDLYRYDLDAPEGHRLILLSADDEPGDDPGSGVADFYGVSDDGSYAYFSTFSQLVSGGQLIAPGEGMVYVWHDSTVAFVGTVTVDDANLNAPDRWPLSRRTARVAPDGKHMLFVSRSPNEPTGDSSAACAAGPCVRAYVYSADANGGAGALACASCRTGGVPATTDALITPRIGAGGAMSDPHLSRALSDDGKRVFFSTGDPLVPDDRNGEGYDAYMYDVQEGRAHLISGGTGGNSYFMDASSDGSDVFFTTRTRLVGNDQDDSVDLYDARVGGGFPEPVSPPAPCPDAEACKGVVDTAPSGPTLGSLSLVGPEDSLLGAPLPVFYAATLSKSQLRGLVAGSRVTIGVRVSDGGRVSARLRGRLGGRVRSAGAAARVAHGGGVVRLRLKLAAWARAKVHRDGRLKLVLTVHYGPVSEVQRQTLLLIAQQGGGR